MAGAAAAGAGVSPVASTAGGGMNPFQVATNLYAEQNNQNVTAATLLTSTAVSSGGAINAGQYLRGLRLILRTTTAGKTIVTTGVGLDLPWSIFQSLDLVNVDGSEILYSMGGYAYYLSQKYFRPWLCDPMAAYDYNGPVTSTSTASSTVVSGTLVLQPEIRWTAGVLANTDTRSQYRYDQTIVGANSATTQPTVSVTPYMDAWAQPDAVDLQGTPNQPVPPGVNLQTKRRHQVFTLNAISSDNILQIALTGNAIRGMILVLRDTSAGGGDRTNAEGTLGASGISPRANYSPFYWFLDNRSLGKLSFDVLTQWAQNFYGQNTFTNTAQPNQSATTWRPKGVMPFPRFFDPGNLTGQGWLYTANSTKLIFEFTTPSGFTNPGTAEVITDEVYPVGPVDPSLVDI